MLKIFDKGFAASSAYSNTYECVDVNLPDHFLMIFSEYSISASAKGAEEYNSGKILMQNCKWDYYFSQHNHYTPCR